MASIIKRGEGYQVKVRIKGHPGQTATFKRLTDAKRWGAQTEAAIRERRFFKTAEAEKHTLTDLADRYIAEVLPTKPKSEYKQKQQMRWWKSQIGAYTLADVTPALLAECRDRLASTPTKRGPTTQPASVIRYMAALSHAFTIAVKEWGWLEDNPMLKVSKPKEPRGRVRFLSDNERDSLLQACRDSEEPYLHPIVVLALSTGMRQGEIMGLTWDAVDLRQCRITLTETKNGERRTIPVTGKALELLKDHQKIRQIDTPLLFPGRKMPGDKPRKPKEIRKAWLAAVERAGVENFRFHDLRHTAASYLAMSGATLAEIAEILGHKTLAMVKRYSHFSTDHVSGVISRLDDRMFGAE